MKRIINVDMNMNVKKVETAFKRFFKRYPELDYWLDTFHYMYENNVSFFCDNVLVDGSVNEYWRYALHLDVDADHIYIAVIERE